MEKVKRPNYSKILVKEKADTDDILKEVLAAIKETNANDIKPFLRQQKITADDQGMQKLWNWCKKNIKYKEDDSENQAIQNANYTFYEKRKGTDCKSFTVFMCKCFEALNLPYTVRFAGYSKRDGQITHVYPIVHLKGSHDVIMDAVWYKFNSQKRFSKNKDYNMAKIYRVSGTAIGNNIFQKAGDFIKSKTIGKFAALFLYAYYPYPLIKGSPTARKVEKSRKALSFFKKNPVLSEAKTDDLIRKAIKVSIKMTPEEYFKSVVEGKKVTGIGVVVATVVTIVSALVPLFIAIINKQSGANLTKEDVVPNEEEIREDNKEAYTAKVQQKGNNDVKPSAGSDTATSNDTEDDIPRESKTPSNGAGTKTDKDNTMLYFGVAAVAAFVILKK